MKDSRLVLEEVWKCFVNKRDEGRILDVREILKTIMEAEPDLSNEEYLDLLKTVYGKHPAPSGMLTPPSGFNAFVEGLASIINPKKMLIPLATGFEPDMADAADFFFLDKGMEEIITQLKDVNTLEALPQTGNYDLIFSALPLGPIKRDFISCQIVEQCATLLSEDGYCVFTFSKGITHQNNERWLSSLEGKGLYCAAMLDLPVGAFAPVSSVDGEVVVFTRRKRANRFSALLSDPEQIGEIVNNFINGKTSTKNERLGICLDEGITCYSDFARQRRLHDYESVLGKTYNAQLVRLSDIGEIRSMKHVDVESNKADNAVYIPQAVRKPVILDIVDENINPSFYYRIIVNPDRMLPRFLAFFLNTEAGEAVRNLSVRSPGLLGTISISELRDMIVPCPSIKQQSLYLETYEGLEVLRIEVERLKNQLQKSPASYAAIQREIKDLINTGDRFTQWIETLPYPIATILKKYSVDDEMDKKQEDLLFFFEAYSIFEAALLSAVLNRELIDCSALNEVGSEYFEKAAFGSWIMMDRALSNLFLRLINDSSDEKRKIALACFKTSDHNLIKLICHKNVCNILEQAKDHRNNWRGHSGVTSDSIYREHVDVLDSMLHKFQDAVKDVYERVRLIRPVSLSLSDGVYTNGVEILTGSNPMFKKETIVSLIPLDTAKLYLQIMDSGEIIELPPYFILKNSPADVKNACYFYNKVEKGNSRYVSYHYDGKPEDIETGEKAFAYIKTLLEN